MQDSEMLYHKGAKNCEFCSSQYLWNIRQELGSEICRLLGSTFCFITVTNSSYRLGMWSVRTWLQTKFLICMNNFVCVKNYRRGSVRKFSADSFLAGGIYAVGYSDHKQQSDWVHLFILPANRTVFVALFVKRLFFRVSNPHFRTT